MHIILIEDQKDDIFLIKRKIIEKGWGFLSLPDMEAVRTGLIKGLSSSESGQYVILLDGCIPEKAGAPVPYKPNTQETITIAREWGFRGPIIAISDAETNNDLLIEAGADRGSRKDAAAIISAIEEVMANKII